MKKLGSFAAAPGRLAVQVAAVTAIALTLLVSSPRAAGNNVTPPPVPVNLEITDGSTAYLIGHAYGTQNYICLPSGSGFAWTLFGPQATLFDDDGRQIITHFLSANPDENGTLRATWQHSGDTSAAWAMAVATATSSEYPSFVAAGAIPWLKLQVMGAAPGPQLGAKLIRTTFVQRVNTSGGLAPVTGCSVSTNVGAKAFMPYTADYVFYRQ